jgi:hypothetical protein
MEESKAKYYQKKTTTKRHAQQFEQTNKTTPHPIQFNKTLCNALSH